MITVVKTALYASLLIFIAAAGSVKGSDLTSSNWPTQGWPVAAPETEGLDSAALADLVQWARAERVDSLLVVRHGKIVLDAYFAPFKPGIRHDLYSATKSFVGTLTAVAIQDHLLDSVDHPVIDLFQDKSIALVDERKKKITVQHLLDMTSGFEWDGEGGPRGTSWAMHRSADPTKFVLDQPMKTEPGQSFYYDNGNPYVLSALITKLTGQNAMDFAKRELFGPLGISDVDWAKPDAQNVVNGETHLSLLPADMAKLGYLYLHKGEWDKKQIVPASWVERARSGVIDAGHGFRYANLWWSRSDESAYMAQGSHGQLIIVIPDADIVTVLTAAKPDAEPSISAGDVADYVSKCVRADKDLPPNLKGEARLRAALQSAAREQRDDMEEPSPLAAEFSGKTYDFDSNPLRLKSLSFNLSGADPTWSVARQKSATNDAIETASGPIGLNGVFPNSLPQKGAPLVKGHWTSATSFEVQRRVLGQGVVDRFIFDFRGAAIDVHFENNEGMTAQFHGTIRQ